MSSISRLNLLLIIFLLFGFLILSRLFYWQVLSYEDLATAAEAQHFITFEIPAERGKILDSDSFPLAANREVFLLYGSPGQVEDAPGLAATLSSYLASPSAALETEEKIKERLSRSDLVWVPLQRRVDREIKEKIQALNLKGIGFESEQIRAYPEGSMAAHLLGFVGSDENGYDQGYFGLEGYYDLQLKGRPGKVRQEKDASGRPLLVGGFGRDSSKNGRELVLYLDRAIQFFVEEKLKSGIEKFGAKAGSAIVMDPKTGGILAMASFPNYDPENYNDFERQLYKNPVVADLFEPGSIMKPLVMAAALDNGAVDVQTKCDLCAGPRQIGKYTISTFNDQYYPNSSMDEIIIHSDNVGMVFVAEKLGKERLYSYLLDLGFAKMTGIDLQDEAQTYLRPAEKWGEIDLATASFGQGIAVTRLQMVQAFGVLANGGRLMKPRLVKNLIEDGKVIEIEKDRGDQVVEPWVARVMGEILAQTTEKSPLKFPKERISGLTGYRIAAKSGTAEIPVAGEYDPEKTIASVIGFAPVKEPRFVVLVSLVEPTARPWGSDTAGPIFFEIMNELFLYSRIQPS